MVRTRPVAGGGLAVELSPEHLAGWFDRFAGRHGGVVRTVAGSHEVVVTAADGATATAPVPFPPLPGVPADRGELMIERLVEHALRPWRIGLVLVRLGGHSVGIAEGSRVLVSATGRRPVHGRTAAGGWSQQRFARRRQGQARQALAVAVEDVLRILVPRAGELDAVVLGGDRHALEIVRADPRLAPVMALAQRRVLEVSEPRRQVLDEAAQRARSVEVVVREGSTGASGVRREPKKPAENRRKTDRGDWVD